MDKVYFEIKDNVVIKYMPVPQIREGIYKSEIVMDKETFIKCFEKWIKVESEVSNADSD